MKTKTPLPKLSQIWLVRGTDMTGRVLFMFAFSTREAARTVYAKGEKEVTTLHWTIDMVPFDWTDFATHDVEQLKAEQDAI